MDDDSKWQMPITCADFARCLHKICGENIFGAMSYFAYTTKKRQSNHLKLIQNTEETKYAEKI